MGIRLVVIYRHLNGHDPAFHTACKIDTTALEEQSEEEIQKAIKTLVDGKIQAFAASYPEFKNADFYSIDLPDEHLQTVVL